VRLFLDANVLFNAARNREGRAASLFHLAERGFCALVASPHAVEEARRNLELKHPGLVTPLDRLVGALSMGRESSADGAAWARAHLLPPQDAPILGAAAEARADLLVTGDRTHFGHLYGKTLRGVGIVTPAEALARVLAGPRPCGS